ncbi:DUF1214 domain-containing protein [Phenylobacterium sp. LjRoot219]|uniref:hypothetical protein n=1 Tax=Phenylobacterium sp. LjRoot219 TaxID=3342283 RepID=UPI003ED04B49
MKTLTAFAGALAVLAADAGSGSAAPAVNSPAQAAWLRYQETLRLNRERFLASEFVSDPQLRAQGLYFLQSQEVSAFNTYVAPRQQYPALYVQSMFMPLELSWGMPNPDFLNHNGFIDGRHTYRIYGNRRGNEWATIQVFRGFWGDEVQGNQGNIDFDDVPTNPDGSFEIFLGPNPPADPKGKYWFKLDPEVRNAMLAMRETAYDWTREEPMEVHIEVLDRDPGAPIYFDEAELAARIDKATKWSVASFEFAMQGAKRLLGERNVFVENPDGRAQGGNPLGHWITMLYDLKPDEALIVEMPVVPARYWGFQLGSVWGQTTDYSYHQSSINGKQAHVDGDGRFRAVLALKDPGVPNWLDPAGLPIGTCLLRFYKADETVTPTVIKVPLAEVRQHLPKDTPVVTPEARGAALDARRRASLRRYGQ